MKIIFAIHDQGLEPGAIPIPKGREKELNEKGYGIFWTVNSFKSLHRTENNLESLDCFYADVDCCGEMTKESAMEIISTSSISPSMLIETKNGYHVYWEFRQPVINPSEEDIFFYKSFLKNIIVPAFKSDKSATDASRLLRVPGFLHQKEKDDPFKVKVIFNDGPKYSFGAFKILFQKKIDEIESSLKLKKKTIEKKIEQKSIEGKSLVVNGEVFSLETEDDKFWENANRLDIESCLRKLNRKKEVNGDSYSLGKTDRSGRRRIHCNGKPSNAWIDKENKIGSTSNGGPTIVNWLLWYGHSKHEVAKIIKEYLI